MVLICVALARDLRSDPLVRRGLRSTRAIEQAVEFGQREYGDSFFVPVKPHAITRPVSVETGDLHHRHAKAGDGRANGTPHASDVPAQRTDSPAP
jgi:hypothetical protein